MARVAVIGAGIGGMAAAARLAVKGHQVVIYEQAATAGGKAGRYERDGFRFDTGPSLLTLPAVYRDLFLKTGAALEDTLDLVPVEPGFRYEWSDGARVVLPGVGPARAADALGDAFGDHARADWRAAMSHAARVWQLTRREVLESPISGPRDLLALGRDLGDLRAIAPHVRLHRFARSAMRDPHLVWLIDRYATYTGSDPRKAPSALITIPYIEQTFGAWHIRGGLARLSAALYERCLERGVKVEFGAAVTGVSTGPAGVTGIELDGGRRVAADVAVSDADSAVLYERLITDRRADAARRRLRGATPSASAFTMLLALRGRTPGLAHHNVWFPAGYLDEFTHVFAGRTPDDPAIYVCCPDDDSMRPGPGYESWFVLVTAPRHGHARHEFDWDAPGAARQYGDQVLGLLAARGTDVRDRILWQVVRTPADLERETHCPGGSIYGPSSNGMRAAFLRPANRSPVPGLFLVGGSAHPGGGLPLVGMSAEIVANLIGRA